MEYDFNTVVIAKHTGYGNASRQLVRALADLQAYNVPCSDLVLNFCMPTDYRYGKHTIGYTPWESTEVPEKWLDGLKKVDDLWSTSHWSSSQLSRISGRKVFTLPHGIDEVWKPVEHKRNQYRPFTFIHVGDPAIRKGGDIVLEAWYKHFRNRTDVKLIYKCVKYPIARVKDKTGSILASPGSLDNVHVISSVLEPVSMWAQYVGADCMVYPTRGEGFGLIPFEAMASGLPTIIPDQGGTSEFSSHTLLKMHSSIWVNSNSDQIHPGLWMDHDIDEVIALMEHAIENYEEVAKSAWLSAHDIHSTFAWSNIARTCIDRMSGRT